MKFIAFAEGDARLDWLDLTHALAEGHELPKAKITDSFLYRGDDTLLNRAAWIDGLGLLVKSATIFPGNRDAASVNGGACLYSDVDGTLEAVIDFHLLTKWKTASDSLLAARRLARKGSERILIVGAGTVAASLIEAYSAAFPNAGFTIWNRSPDRARALADHSGATVADDLHTAVAQADIVACATMSTEPVIRGAWLKPGQHIDLIGAYRSDMREADTETLRCGRLFVDSRDTTLHHIGELKIPFDAGEIGEDTVVADHYDPVAFCRTSDDDITVFKNGGGAHLDLMTARHILGRFK